MRLNEIIDKLKKDYPNDVILLDSMDEIEMRVYIATIKLIEDIERMAEGDSNGRPTT